MSLENRALPFTLVSGTVGILEDSAPARFGGVETFYLLAIRKSEAAISPFLPLLPGLIRSGLGKSDVSRILRLTGAVYTSETEARKAALAVARIFEKYA